MKKVKFIICALLLTLFTFAIPFKAQASFTWDRCCFAWSGNQYIGFIEIMDCWYLGGSCQGFGDCGGCY